MKKWLTIGLAMCLAAVILSGCGEREGNGQEAEAEPRQILYSVMIDENEVRVGETTMQVLLDDGLTVSVSDMTDDNETVRYEVDPEAELEPNSYYSGGSVSITDHIFAHISFVTGEASVRMGDAVIARMEFYMTGAEEAERQRIVFNGVPVSEISREKAGEMFPDFEGDDNMLLEYGRDYDYFLSFEAQEGMLDRFSLARKYDVDWSSGE